MANRVRLQATELDVHVDDVRVGMVTDCGDCWRARMYGRRRRKMFDDFDNQDQAVAAVVAAVSP